MAASTTTNIVYIEGNIGTGKSTLLDALKAKYASDPTVGFLDEPTACWDKIADRQGMTILEKYYANQTKYAFSFQMMAFISRISSMRAALKKNYRILISERSVYTDSEVFAKMLFNDGKIEDVEYAIYMTWIHEFIGDLPAGKFIYVQADPSVSFQRVGIRNRPGEVIPLTYLENCHSYHDEWLLNRNTSPLLVLNANSDTQKDANVLDYWLTEIHQFIEK
jgi:deoxyadenosine/deoxycytidine kinase